MKFYGNTFLSTKSVAHMLGFSGSTGSVPTEKSVIEILGWRGWNLEGTSDAPVLVGMFYEVPWDGPVLVADHVPSPYNTSGIHALNSLTSLQEHYASKAPVWGQVALSGRVVEHENGYRAERGVIRSLTVNPISYRSGFPDTDELVRALEQRYGVDVTLAPWPEADRLAWEAEQERQKVRAAAFAEAIQAVQKLAESMQALSLSVNLLRDSFGQIQVLIGQPTRASINSSRPTRQYYHGGAGTVFVGPVSEEFEIGGDLDYQGMLPPTE